MRGIRMSEHRRTGAVAGLAGVLVSVALVAAPAAASAQVVRSVQAGYYVSPGEAVSFVQASFVAPTVTCQHVSGVQQLRFGVVAPQINSTISEFAQLDATCTNGHLSYGGLLSANAHVGIAAVAPGDSITVKLFIADSGTTSQLVNHTDHVTYEVDGLGQTLDQTAFIGNRPDMVDTAIPTFSSPVHFTDVRVNSTPIVQDTRLRYNQVHGSHLLISTSALAARAFDLTFVANT